MSINIKGLDDIEDMLDGVVDDSKIEAALGKACALVERVAKQKAPKGEGELRRSITSRIDTEDGELVGIVYTPLEYAPYVEYGTGLFAENGNGRKEVPWVYVEGNTSSTKSSRRFTEEEANATVEYLRSKGLKAFKSYGEKPQPYLRPALNENREEILRILGEALLND